jgi:uncharacterized membrane protein
MYALALVIGIIAGLRTLTAPTAISWAAWSGRLALENSWLAFLGYSWMDLHAPRHRRVRR